jgi:hypothetical protein
MLFAPDSFFGLATCTEWALLSSPRISARRLVKGGASFCAVHFTLDELSTVIRWDDNNDHGLRVESFKLTIFLRTRRPRKAGVKTGGNEALGFLQVLAPKSFFGGNRARLFGHGKGRRWYFFYWHIHRIFS